VVCRIIPATELIFCFAVVRLSPLQMASFFNGCATAVGDDVLCQAESRIAYQELNCSRYVYTPHRQIHKKKIHPVHAAYKKTPSAKRTMKFETENKKVRIRGIEPRSVPWEGTMIPLHQMRCLIVGILMCNGLLYA
jgi:hypothetical protein